MSVLHLCPQLIDEPPNHQRTTHYRRKYPRLAGKYPRLAGTVGR
jgi:hypothetical protein